MLQLLLVLHSLVLVEGQLILLSDLQLLVQEQVELVVLEHLLGVLKLQEEVLQQK